MLQLMLVFFILLCGQIIFIYFPVYGYIFLFKFAAIKHFWLLKFYGYVWFLKFLNIKHFLLFKLLALKPYMVLVPYSRILIYFCICINTEHLATFFDLDPDSLSILLSNIDEGLPSGLGSSEVTGSFSGVTENKTQEMESSNEPVKPSNQSDNPSASASSGNNLVTGHSGGNLPSVPDFNDPVVREEFASNNVPENIMDWYKNHPGQEARFRGPRTRYPQDFFNFDQNINYGFRPKTSASDTSGDNSDANSVSYVENLPKDDDKCPHFPRSISHFSKNINNWTGHGTCEFCNGENADSFCKACKMIMHDRCLPHPAIDPLAEATQASRKGISITDLVNPSGRTGVSITDLINPSDSISSKVEETNVQDTTSTKVETTSRPNTFGNLAIRTKGESSSLNTSVEETKNVSDSAPSKRRRLN